MITVLVGKCISWMQVQNAAHRHVLPEKLCSISSFLPRAWGQAASRTGQRGNLLERLLSGGIRGQITADSPTDSSQRGL